MKDYVIGGEKDKSGFTKIPWSLVKNLTDKAKTSSVKRELYLLHQIDRKTNTSKDPIQKLILAIEKGTYLIPHKHNLSKTETTICIQGRVAVLIFDDKGNLRDYCIIGPKEEFLGTKTNTDNYHTSIAFKNKSVIVEFTEGPYNVNTHKQRAKWAPVEGSDEGKKWVKKLEAKIKELA